MSSSDWMGGQEPSKKDHPILQTATVLIRHSEDFPVEVLDDEGNHEILGRVLLREYHEDGRLLIAELLSVYGGIKAEDLLHLAVQESVESGEDGGENRGHSLLRRVEGGTGEPLGLVVGRELVQQELELVFSLDP